MAVFKNDRKQLVQLRNNGFSFNRLAPYTTLDDYLPQIKSAWNTYIEIVSPIQVRMIRLRYVNRFLLPFEGKSMRLEEYFKNSPQLPDEKNLVFLSFVNQYSAVERETGHQVISLLTTQPPENSELPIIFDNSGIAHVNMEPQNWKEIRAKILQLRDLKNNIFWNTLTEKCLNQFQQQ
ncbi:MAG: TIGR04255 family protein [Chloracidobacterium sp.]|nr:TIGR04255 family protein [Chloracidobacterium sp.]